MSNEDIISQIISPSNSDFEVEVKTKSKVASKHLFKLREKETNEPIVIPKQTGVGQTSTNKYKGSEVHSLKGTKKC